jgi:hypothetical protein
MDGPSNIVVPFGLALTLIVGRSLTSPQRRMPRPYEFGSAGVIYMGAGLAAMASAPLGTAIAWGYLVALLLAPTSADFIQTLAGGVKSAPGSTSSQQQAATSAVQSGGAAQPAQ